MEKKLYLPPESRLTLVRTEQGICYSSDEAAQIVPKEGDVNVKDYTEIENDITFE